MSHNTVYTTFSDIFRIGVGPSSSHTVGPMRAARNFARILSEEGLLNTVDRIQCELLGSLGATGIGHLTPNAIMAGLQGFKPNTYEHDKVKLHWDDLGDETHELVVYDEKSISFDRDDISFSPNTLHPRHTNALILRAFSGAKVVKETTYISPGGGAVEIEIKPGQYEVLGVVVDSNERMAIKAPKNLNANDMSDYKNASELVAIAERYNVTIAEIARRQEEIHYGDEFNDKTLSEQLDYTWEIMNGAIDAGLDEQKAGETICDRLSLTRRAPDMYKHYQKLVAKGRAPRSQLLSCFALAVNEQNAIGERIVTAPTAGSAGVIPAVLRNYIFETEANGWVRPRKLQAQIREFLLTAAIFGSIIKANGSISGAECGCQAEIGSACAMAAAGLTAIMGGSPAQCENAAEIALEYHFGLTCDPVGGLVFIPCIERNAMAANTAVTASELALAGDGSHKVSLDVAIETMRQTGIDMNDAYKETAKAGLATNVSC